ncbi:MAG TPA: ParB/RepB/Spo0J family partition protein [Candidatus Ruthenibacterium merdigallinarum]|nr:ParB/RepB/Spo0J family partition protein [Candidatus Ruthenibacterium merdigallinarum]
MAPKKGGLGQGLGSLFAQADSQLDEEESGALTLRLAEVSPDKNQPRRTFDETALGELASSILEHGVLQPIVVRPAAAGGYTIVAGERRWRAARIAGLSEIPAIVRNMTDEQAMEIALIENLQREDLDPVEEAMGYRQLMDRCGYTQEQAAARLGRSRSAVANSLRLLHLPQKALELLRSGAISAGHAKAILSLEGRDAQDEAAQLIADKGLSVREAEALCKRMSRKPPRKKELLRPALPTEVELSLAERLGTEVKVRYQDGRGSLQIHFYSDDQLRAFANLLGEYQTGKL